MSPEQLIEKFDLPDSFHEIDPDDLAGEWSRQPGAFLRTAMRLASAEREEARAKAALEECEATLSRECRENPEKFRIAKLSVEAVSNAVVLHKDYKAARDKHVQAQYLVKLLKAAVGALEHKKKALESAVYLQGQGLFAAPKAKEPKDAVRMAMSPGKKKRAD